MTEHAAVIFVFFFSWICKYILICILISTLFLGGYLFDFLIFFIKLKDFFIYSMDFINSISLFLIEGIPYRFIFENINNYEKLNLINLEEDQNILSYYSIDGLLYSLSLGFKTCLMIFIFIWVRASLPRIRFDKLMSFCWTILLPIIFAFIILIPCFIYSFDILSINIPLF